MTEWGVPASKHTPDEPFPSGKPEELPNNAEGQATFIEYHYKDMVQHSTLNNGVSSGGMLFMWADQWDKQPCDDCSPRTHDGTPSGPAGNFPGNWHDEEWFGIHSVSKDPNRPWDKNWDVAANKPYPPDTLTERAAYTTISKLFTEPDPEIGTNVAAGVSAAIARTSPINEGGEEADLQVASGDRPDPLAAALSNELHARYGLDYITLMEGKMNGGAPPWNDLDHLDASSSDVVHITFSLHPNSKMGADAHWYTALLYYPFKDSETFTVFHLSGDGVWKEAQDQELVLPIIPSYVGDLFQLEDLEVFRGSLDPGYYEFIFAVSTLRSDWSGYDLYIDGEAVEVAE
jgi:hypothetical protein